MIERQNPEAPQRIVRGSRAGAISSVKAHRNFFIQQDSWKVLSILRTARLKKALVTEIAGDVLIEEARLRRS
jgi:hypothetical protein